MSKIELAKKYSIKYHDGQIREVSGRPNPEHCHDSEMEDVVKEIESLGCFDIIAANYYADKYSFEVVAQKNDKPVITPIERIEM